MALCRIVESTMTADNADLAINLKVTATLMVC